MLWWYGLAAVVVLACAAVFFFRRGAYADSGATSSAIPKSVASTSTTRVIAFDTPEIVAAQTTLHKLAFGVTRVDYQILGEHVRVLQRVEEALAGALNESKYFPRKPALLPKLLRAINSLDANRNEIVRLILQDAVLAGNVLKRANSAFYRPNQDVVESIDRAVTILGNEGLRAPVAMALMQPVFQLPQGFFDQFAPTTWELARRTGVAAEEFARTRRTADAFVAHLAGMLGGLGRIALFRLTYDTYRERGNLMPRAEVFVRVMNEHGAHMTHAIAAAWELSEGFVEALDSQRSLTPPNDKTPLAATVYYANLCGLFSTLHAHDLVSSDTALAQLAAQGLDDATAAKLWSATVAAEVT